MFEAVQATVYHAISAMVDNYFYTPFFDRLESRNRDIKILFVAVLPVHLPQYRIYAQTVIRKLGIKKV